jgi:hypothetical protein
MSVQINKLKQMKSIKLAQLLDLLNILTLIIIHINNNYLLFHRIINFKSFKKIS